MFNVPSVVSIIKYYVENFKKFIRFPTIELEYNDGISVSPTTRWIGNLVLQIVSTLSSANSTFSVLIDRMYINNLKVRIIFPVIQKSHSKIINFYKKTTGRPPGAIYSIFFILKLMGQIAFQTFVAFMVLWLTLFYDRWGNYREFMSRNYSSLTVSVISGFVIFLVFPALILGHG